MREVVGPQGEKIAIPARIERIGAAGAMNQVIYMLGAGDKIVATSEFAQKGFFSVIYPRIKEVPTAYAGPGPGVLNMETLLAARPQIVFGSYVNDKDVETLASAGIVLLGLKLDTPEDIKSTILMIGEIIGPEAKEKAVEFNRYYDENMEYAREKTKNAPKVKVFAADSDGGSGPIDTAPGNDILTSYIEAAGGANIAAGKLPTALADGSALVDFEFLNMERPNVIITQNRKIYDYIMDPSNGSQWQNLEAVRNRRVFVNPYGAYLWSARSAEGALESLWLAKVLHPELSADLDMEQIVRDFFKKYYYYNLSDKEVQEILFPVK